MPATSTINPTGSSMVDGVLSGGKWAVNNFTFSFPTSGSYYGSGYGDGEPTNGFEALNSSQQTTARAVLKSYSSVANISFNEIAESSTQHADLRFAESDAPATAWGYYPTTLAEGGDTWFNNSGNYYDNPVKGNYAYATFMHEVGHGLGLKHPHEVSGSFAAMPTAYDSMEYTVLSYRSYVGGSTTTGYTNETWGYAQSLMMADIAGLQAMYGANYSTNSGNSTYSWSPTTGQMFINGIGQGAAGGNKIFLTVWDGGGVDTYDFSSYSGNLTVNLAPGGWSTTSVAQLAKLHYDGSKVAVGNIANALLYKNDTRSLIENATGGAGSDVIAGNVTGNVLKGAGGNDRLTGGAGNDTLDGGAGTDTAVFSGKRSDYAVTLLTDGSYRVADSRSGAPDGTDIVWNTDNFQFSDKLYSASELGTTTSTTSTSTLTLYGDSGNNVLTGAAGNDKIYGKEGNDTLIGGLGGDYLAGGSGVDRASYASAKAGVVADLTYASKNAGDAKGDTYNSIENLLGSAYADSLTGNSAANVLEGGGGADKLFGGSGIDTASYTGAKAAVTADLTSAANNKGDAAGDTFSGIENLTGSAFGDRLVGSSSVNVLVGAAGNDTLDARAGADKLYGREGNDLLVGGAGADILDGGLGIDTASYTTAASYVVADLTTTSGSVGDAYLDKFSGIENLTGSAYADTLKGNTAANVLTGGAGADKLYGREGNDTLVGGAGNDTLDGGAGTDVAVYSGLSSDYRQTQNLDGSWTITDLRAGSPDGSDTLIGIETLRFTGASASASKASHQGAEHVHEPENIPLPHQHADWFDFTALLQGKQNAFGGKSGFDADDLSSFLENSAWRSADHDHSTPHDHSLHVHNAPQHHSLDHDWIL